MTEVRSVFRVGIVQAQDLTNCRVRVTFSDRNQMRSWWLPIVRQGTQNDKDYWIPDIGEQVVCHMDEHDEDGAVLGTIFSSADTAPASMTGDQRLLKPKDGAVFQYDRNLHALTVSIPSGGTVTITCNGATVGIDSSGNVNLTAQGNITLKTDHYSDSVDNMISVFNEHTHGGVQTGGSNTAIPNQQLT
jgi:phage baseplate assembly protein V